MITEPIYTLRTKDVFHSLETSPEGLSHQEAQDRLALYGRNTLSEKPKDPLFLRLAAHIFTPQVGILIVISILFLIQDDWPFALAIFILSIANSFFALWREYRAEQAIQKLQEILPVYTRVLRQGQEESIPASHVVPGDILILAEGDNISADARVIEEYGLRVNNATLTGESMAAKKGAEASDHTDISELEQPNLIFAGTSIASGTGRAVVYATGMLTQFGRLAHLTQATTDEPSHFQNELRHLTNVITLIAAAVAALVMITAFTQEQLQDIYGGYENIVLLGLGILVAATPEGLPATLTLALARAVQRLATIGVLAKKLITVETLGNVSVICTDKSGTLTQNQMTVREIWVSQQNISVKGVGYEPKGEFEPSPDNQIWEEDFLTLLEAAACCNNSRLQAPTAEHPMWSGLGDQTEVALKVTAVKAQINEASLGILYPRVHEIPFDARRKRMTTIHREMQDELAFTKGAPREVLQLCTNILINGQIQPLTEDLRAEIMAANDTYARRALRVLGVAKRVMPLKSAPYNPETTEQNLTFLGLIAMMDPPRPEVEKAVQICREAGIRIVMITGDYGLTAESLARRVGMLTTPNARIITGAELDEMTDIEIQKNLQGEVLFARMAPEHKMRMVAAFQSRGDVVAVTGDGVNDAPALRKADVGIAMGIVGTDVAKEAADIILTNDNFGAIADAIKEGRGVFDNIRKFITYIFSSNVPEIMPFLLTASFPAIPLALTVRQVLAIDLGTDFLPAIALGMEKPEPDVMKKPPRRPNQPLIDNGLLTRAFLWLGMIETVLCYIAFFSIYILTGNAELIGLGWVLDILPIPESFITALNPETTTALAVTSFHAGVVLSQIGNAMACRSDRVLGRSLKYISNPFLIFALIAELIGILAIIYIPGLAQVFGHIDLPFSYWIGIGSFPFILYALESIRKQIVFRKTNKIGIVHS